MPHLRIEHSPNLSARVDLALAARLLHEAMTAPVVFPLSGIRVRCLAAGACSIADGHPANAFAHLELRVGAGRDVDTLRRAGEAIFRTAREIFAEELERGHFALSLEIVEIEEATSWKANGIRKRLEAEGHTPG